MSTLILVCTCTLCINGVFILFLHSCAVLAHTFFFSFYWYFYCIVELYRYYSCDCNCIFFSFIMCDWYLMMSACLFLSYILHGDYYQALPLIPLIKLWKQVYRRMIKCCGYLQCHTQVAVLCQFLDETDYSAAFKALQERNTHDAMDAYYSCIWDITILEFLVRILSFWKAFFERIKHVCWFTDVWVFCCTVVGVSTICQVHFQDTFI